MEIILEHPAVKTISQEGWKRLLLANERSGKTCKTFNTFCARIEKIAQEITKIGVNNPYYHNADVRSKYPEKYSLALANKFKGDVFEVFGEVLLKQLGMDDRIDISDYHPFLGKDTGVDGAGKARDGTPATVQIKYRGWRRVLTEKGEHLDTFKVTSFSKKFGVDPGSTNNMLIITAGNRVHWKTLDRDFLAKVKCLNRNSSYRCIRGAKSETIDNFFSLKTLVDGKLFFWEKIRALTC